MEKFARIVVGYHGCRGKFARGLLLGTMPIEEWQYSENDYDWLGKGFYFWEHSPARALRWAKERYGKSAAVVGAIIQLGACFELMDEQYTMMLAESFEKFRSTLLAVKLPLPTNRGTDWKMRERDCAAINNCLDKLEKIDRTYDTVRGAFLEGTPIFEGTTISSETHIQIAVRNCACILGVFRPK